ncbi:MAG: XkdF-like putative serine protease domain-containing protein, partial [Rhodospirillaceae bacterium]
MRKATQKIMRKGQANRWRRLIEKRQWMERRQYRGLTKHEARERVRAVVRKALTTDPPEQKTAEEESPARARNTASKSLKDRPLARPGSVSVSKSAAGGGLYCEVRKADDGSEERIVLGPVLVPGIKDHDGDIYTAEEIRKAMIRYMVASQKADVQHNEQPVNTPTVENWQTRMVYPAGVLGPGSPELPEGTWM